MSCLIMAEMYWQILRNISTVLTDMRIVKDHIYYKKQFKKSIIYWNTGHRMTALTQMCFIKQGHMQVRSEEHTSELQSP